MSRRKVRVRVPLHTTNNYGNLKLVSDTGKTLLEITGYSEVGRPKVSKKKSNFLGKWLGSYGHGTNKILFWDNEYGDLQMTVKGGLHNVSFNFESDFELMKFYKELTKAIGLKINKRRNGSETINLRKKLRKKL